MNKLSLMGLNRFIYKKSSIESAINIMARIGFEKDVQCIERYILERLNIVWNDAYNNVPYYKVLKMKIGLPSRFENLKDVIQMPLLTKEIIKNNPSMFLRKNPGRTRTLATGGSTGEPLRFQAWPAELAELDGGHIMQRALYGVGPGDPLFLIWGHGHLYGSGLKRYLNISKRYIADRMLGIYRESAYDLKPESMQKIFDKVLILKPSIIITYTTALKQFIKANLSRISQISKIGLKMVTICAEPVTDDEWEFFHDKLKCPIVSEYASVETGVMAFADKPGNYLVNWPQFLLQRTGSAKQFGANILVTKLVKSYLPLIRYEIGDQIEPITSDDRLICGPILFLKKILGRKFDVLTLRDGNEIHGSTINDCIRLVSKIERFQVIEQNGSIIIKYISQDELNKNEMEFIKNNLAIINPLLSTTIIERVRDIPLTNAGKHRFIIHENGNSYKC